MYSKVSTNTAAQISHSIPVVGIGASAGGLEALELFLGNDPPKIDMAFVIEFNIFTLITKEQCVNYYNASPPCQFSRFLIKP
jgi:chemotaxis response regulator CheB